MLLSGQHWTFVGIFAGISILCFVIARIFKWWHWKVPLGERPPVPLDRNEGFIPISGEHIEK